VTAKIHPRQLPTAQAKSKLGLFISELAQTYDLTSVELLMMLNEQAATCHKYMLRMERHGRTDRASGLAYEGD